MPLGTPDDNSPPVYKLAVARNGVGRMDCVLDGSTAVGNEASLDTFVQDVIDTLSDAGLDVSCTKVETALVPVTPTP